MGELENELIQKAIRKHKQIFPCAKKAGFDHCFTVENDRLFFWYNTIDKSTHVLSQRIVNAKVLTSKGSIRPKSSKLAEK